MMYYVYLLQSRKRPKRAGQTAMEYAVLAAVLVAALLVMQIYLKRGLSGRIREAADSIGQQYAPRQTTSPGITFGVNSKVTTKADLLKVQDVGDGRPGSVLETTTTINQDTTTRRGSETVDGLNTGLWD